MQVFFNALHSKDHFHCLINFLLICFFDINYFHFHSIKMSKMHQICDGYNPRVLMGNWFEQSYAVKQPARDEPIRVARNRQVEIGFIDNKGKLRALNTVSRLQPWNTNELVGHDDNNGNQKTGQTISKQKFDLPTVSNFHQRFVPQPFQKHQSANKFNKTSMKVNKFAKHHRLFNDSNIEQLIQKRLADEESFKSSLKPNLRVNDKEFLQSIYGLQISRPAEGRMDVVKGAYKSEQKVKSFRRVRSSITLNTTTNFPLTHMTTTTTIN